jgi:hypothetical protein
MKVSFYLSIALWLLAGLLFTAPAQADPTRFEAEIVNAPPTTADSAGYDQYQFWADYAEAGNSNGKIKLAATPNVKMKFLFYGTGVDIIVRKAANGGTFSWKLDSGATTGTVDLYADTLQQQVAVPVARSLALTLHTVEINADLPIDGTAIFIDAFDVYGNLPRYRLDDSNAKVHQQPGKWFADTGLNEPTEAAGGSIIYTTEVGSTVTLQFVGKAISFQGVPRQDSMAFNWSIDHGAYSGTINPRPVAAEGHTAAGLWYRWPYILQTGMVDTTHTLTITATPGPDGANFIFCVDSFDFISDVYVDNTPTRFEMENTDHSIGNPNDLFAVNYTSNVWLLFPENGASGGSLIFTTAGDQYRIKMLFYGTGVDVIGETWADHAPFNWVLDDGVTSGTADVYNGGAITQQLRIPIVGGLPRTLHTLEIIPTGSIIRLDAADVYGSGNITRIDDSRRAIIDYQPSGNWTHDDTTAQVDTEAVNGTISYALTTSDTASFSFHGTAVAIRGRSFSDAFKIGWSIDDGAYTGVLDFAAANPGNVAYLYRWPFLLKTGLPDADHTVKLSILDSPGGFVGMLDSIDLIGSPISLINSAKNWTQFE